MCPEMGEVGLRRTLIERKALSEMVWRNHKVVTGHRTDGL